MPHNFEKKKTAFFCLPYKEKKLRNILSEPFREKCSATKKRQAMRFDELRSLFFRPITIQRWKNLADADGKLSI